MKQYLTEQRKRLLSFLKENEDKQFTVEEIYEGLGTDGEISLSSIYRNISKMEEQGLLRRFSSTEHGVAAYQYNPCGSCGHLHLKCKSCGRVIHLGETESETLIASVRKNSDFDIDEKETILYGTCPDCK